MKRTNDELLREANKLDASYADAAAFDAKMHDKWINEAFEQFTRRTEYPKLGFLIHRLNELGIASIVNGRSFHAPLLYVEKGKLDAAWEILQDGVDDMDDDDPRFTQYADTQPDTDLYER